MSRENGGSWGCGEPSGQPDAVEVPRGGCHQRGSAAGPGAAEGALSWPRGVPADAVHRRPRPGRRRAAQGREGFGGAAVLADHGRRGAGRPRRVRLVTSPEVDVGVPTQICREALAGAPDARCVIVQGRYEHVSFILDAAPLRLRVVEVAPPHPPKLLDQARRVLEVAEDLPPVELEPEVVDIVESGPAASRPPVSLPVPRLGRRARGQRGLLPRRAAVAAGLGAGRLRALAQIHRHFYGDDPPYLDMCPRELVSPASGPVLTKCCQLEDRHRAGRPGGRVPWGATLAEVRERHRDHGRRGRADLGTV